MRKLLLLIATFAALALTACEDPNQQILDDLEKTQGEKGSTIDYDAWSNGW
jgi:hypothetical protein